VVRLDAIILAFSFIRTECFDHEIARMTQSAMESSQACAGAWGRNFPSAESHVDGTSRYSEDSEGQSLSQTSFLGVRREILRGNASSVTAGTDANGWYDTSLPRDLR
jgi:hypothetical protein